VKASIPVASAKVTQAIESRDSKLDQAAAASDASAKNWKAYVTKDPGDMNAAAEASIKAEQVLSQNGQP
jgi:uncharacterized protein YdaU (DUF1376 family)